MKNNIVGLVRNDHAMTLAQNDLGIEILFLDWPNTKIPQTNNSYPAQYQQYSGFVRWARLERSSKV